VQHIRPFLLNASIYLYADCIIITTNENSLSTRHDVYVGPKITSVYVERYHGKSEISHFCQGVKMFFAGRRISMI